jgi:hydrogenase expression/formation protein HypE
MVDSNKPDLSHVACPAPLAQYPTVQLAHGGGGRLSQRLIDELFVRAFRNPALEALHDGARLDTGGQRLAFSTDSFVIRPIFFPGGNIGSLAVHGTVNDIAMCGATPLWLSAGYIIEEGFAMIELCAVVDAMRTAAEQAGVQIVTGDTKVVDRGKGDGVYINTAGVGLVRPGIDIGAQRIEVGDAVIVSGPIADHGIAIMSVREGLQFETAIESDSAALNGLVGKVLDVGGPAVHMLRDPTRGGVASALNEIAASARLGVRLSEAAIPVREAVRGACEILGFDPLYVANEGKCLVIVARDAADSVLAAMRAHERGKQAEIIGEITSEHPGRVTMKSRIGATRVVDRISGEQLPRIC